MTPAPDDNLLKPKNLPRLAFAVIASTPVAGALLAMLLGFTVFNDLIFLTQKSDSEFVPASGMEIIFNTVTVAFSGLMLGGLIGWPVMLAFGLPVHAVLIRKTKAKAWMYVVAGVVLGLAAGCIRFLSVPGGGTYDASLFLAIGAVTGALACIVFWVIRRPDRDAAEYKT